MMSIEPASKTYIVGLVGERICQILQNAASLVPGIGVAATGALMLAQAVQNAEKNKEDFRGLAESCCRITATLAERVDPQSNSEHTHLREDADKLHGDIKFILKYVKKHGKKNSLSKRVWNHFRYRRVIEQCRNRLRNALDMFNLEANIELRQQVADILDGKAKSSSLVQGQEQDANLGTPLTNNQTDIDNNSGTLGLVAPGGNIQIDGGFGFASPDASLNEQTYRPTSLERPNSVPVVPHSRPPPLPSTSEPILPSHYQDNRTKITGNTGIVGIVAPGGTTRISGDFHMPATSPNNQAR